MQACSEGSYGNGRVLGQANLQISDFLRLVLTYRVANNESSEVFDILKPGRRVRIKGHRQ